MNFIVTARRRIIPRWRNFTTTAALGELSALSKKTIIIQPEAPDLAQRKLEWTKNKSLWTAGDLLAASLHARDWEAVQDAALYIIGLGSIVPPITEELARSALRWSHEKTPYIPNPDALATALSFERHQIGKLRVELRQYPMSPVHWMELALAYAVIGKERNAERAVQVALSLAPNDRFVLRSACRFFLHSQQPERAIGILSKAKRTAHDPWLIAAHIAACEVAGKSSHLVKQGRAFSLSETVDPFHLTELNAALGNLEMLSGNDMRATKLFRQSLKSPTENSLAQIFWAKRQLLRGNESKLADLPRTFEASTRFNMSRGLFHEALPFSKLWREDELFSARPAVTTVFLNQLEDHHEDAIAISKIALLSNPDHPILVNGLAYSLALTGDTQSAESTLKRISAASLSEEQKVIFCATEGLIRYREGNPQLGRELYSLACEAAKKISSHLHGLVVLYFAIEEARIDVVRAMKLLQDHSINWGKIIPASGHASRVAKKVSSLIKNAAANPNLGSNDFNLSDFLSLGQDSNGEDIAN